MIRRSATASARPPLLVKDPDHTRLFLPGHKVIVDPDPSDFRDAIVITPDNLKAGAGGGAALVGPAAEP